MAKIQTKTFNYGNEKESAWPPKYGTNEGRGYHGYFDSERGEFVEGDPPSRTANRGKAPMFISDTMPETRHPGTGEVVDSRSRWQAIDKKNGWVTTGSKEDTGTTKRHRDIKAEDADMIGRIKRAVNDIDNGTAPLSEKFREQAKRQDELISSHLGFDAGNVLGRRRNGRTKRYSRK